MGIALRRLGPHGVNLVIFHGRINRDELIGFYRNIDVEDPANLMPWLSYLAPDADMSEIDIPTYAELRRIMSPIREKVSTERKYYLSVVISNSERCDTLIKFWHDFIAKDSKNPPYTILYSDIKDACESLELPDSALGAITETIRAWLGAREAGEASRSDDLSSPH